MPSCFNRVRLLLVLCAFFASITTGQQQDSDVLAEGERYLMSGQYESAIRFLSNHLTTHPRNSRALRMLAQAYYWSGNTRAARQRYEEALRVFPDDLEVRIEAGRFFLETGDTRRSEKILQPIEPSRNADVFSLLGTARYWDGDWDGAKHFFERALAVEPGHDDSRRQLNEILAATPSQLALIPEFQSDNQTIRRTGGIAQYRIHISPLSPLTVEGGLSRATISDTVWTFAHGMISFRYTLPGAHLGIDAAAGTAQISSRNDPEWTYRIGLVLRLPESTTLSGHFERRPYFETIPSFSIPVSLISWSILLDRPESDAWIGQASIQSLRYFDGNTGTNLSAWILFPLGGGKQSVVRLGYGFSYQNTRETRFETTFGQSTGMYIPYYTPLSVISHSIICAITIPASDQLRFSSNGSYGLIASEEITQPTTESGPMGPGPPRSSESAAERSFHPWQARIALDYHPPSSPVRLTLEGTRFATAYYQVSFARLTASYAFPAQLH
jgi:hypothetical protein